MHISALTVCAAVGRRIRDTGTPTTGLEEALYRIVSNSTRRRILRALTGSPGLSFSQVMKEIGMHPGHDTGSFNYHLNLLIKSGAVTGHEGSYALTEQGEKIAASLPHEEDRYEVFRLEPLLERTPIDVRVEEKEEEGIIVPRPTWKGKTLYFYESTYRTPSRSDWMYDTYQVFCLDIHPVQYQQEEFTGIEWLNKTYSPTYHGLARYLEEGRIEVLRTGQFLDLYIRWTDILRREGQTTTETAIRMSQWSCREDREPVTTTLDKEPRRLIFPPKRSYVYPISKKSLGDAYGGEYRVTLGQKTHNTIKVRYGGRKGDATYGEDYIDQDGVAVLVRTYLARPGIENWKVENWKQSPTVILNAEDYYLATESHLKDKTTYR